MASKPTATDADGLVPFAWAGLILDLPPTYRPVKIDGTARKGMIALADDERMRLELAWGVPRGRRFDARRVLQRKLKSNMPPKHRRRGAFAAHIETRDLPPFDTLIGYHDEEQGLDRWLGFVPTTRRALEIVYHHGTSRENRQFRERILPSLADQTPEQPQRWAFFDHRFVTPAGYAYRDSTLNVGDMRVRLVAWNRPWSRASVTIRLIYPAELALARSPLDLWLTDHVIHRKRVHRPRYRKTLRRGGIVCDSVETAIGPGLTCDTYLRPLLKTISWGMPWRLRCWLIHDQKRDRLLLIDAQDKLRRLDAIIDTIVEGLHWPPRKCHPEAPPEVPPGSAPGSAPGSEPGTAPGSSPGE